MITLTRGIEQGVEFFVGYQLLFVMMLLCFSGLTSGLLFQWITNRYLFVDQSHMAVAYVGESMGCLFGGLVSILFVYLGMNQFTSILICAMCLMIMVYYRIEPDEQKINFTTILSTGFLLVFIGLLFMSKPLDHEMIRWKHPHLLLSYDSPYSRITVTKDHDQFTVFENDILSYENEGSSAEILVHLSALQATSFNRVLITGGGIYGILNEVMKYNPTHVDMLEVNQVLRHNITHTLINPTDLQAWIHKNVLTIDETDPRRFLKKDRSFDLIIGDMPEPSTAHANRFYTLEYFELCKQHLSHHGIFAFSLSSDEYFWNPFLASRNASIYWAIKSVFHHVLVLPGMKNIFIASNSPLSSNPKILIDQFIDKKINARFISPAFIEYTYDHYKMTEIENQLNAALIKPNTDIHPVGYPLSIMVWLVKFFPQLVQFHGFFLMNGSWNINMTILLLIFLACMLIFARIIKKSPYRSLLLVFLAGLMGMIWEGLLILYYQITQGILFQNIGLLLTAFMIGLGFGAWAFYKILYLKNRAICDSMIARCLFIGIGLQGLIMVGMIQLNYSANLLGIMILLLSSGCFVSGIFVYSSRIEEQVSHITITTNNNRAILMSKLYAMDLLGGCVGTILGSLILIPFLGFTWSVGLLSVIAFLSICFI